MAKAIIVRPGEPQIAKPYTPTAPSPEETAERLALERQGMVIDVRRLLLQAASPDPITGVAWITQEEGLAWVESGTLPQKLVVAIGSLPAESQFEAHITVRTMQVAYRTDPLLRAVAGAALAQVLGRAPTDDELDEALDRFFRAAMALP